MCFNRSIAWGDYFYSSLFLLSLIFFKLTQRLEDWLRGKTFYTQTLKESETYLQLNSYENKPKIIDENYLLLKVFTLKSTKFRLKFYRIFCLLWTKSNFIAIFNENELKFKYYLNITLNEFYCRRDADFLKLNRSFLFFGLVIALSVVDIIFFLRWS